jgi:hypothetical protein
LALADGQLKPEAVKHLEKVYQLLGIEKAALYSQLHVTSAAPESGKPAAPAQPQTASLPAAGPLTSADSTTTHRESRLRLDAARIAALQRESEHVTAILSKVFEEQEIEKPAPVVSEKSAEEGAPDHARTALLGLDPEHAAFLRALLARPSWSRAELSDMAADMELMLDGALERVNEATLDAFDSRIAEGDDPIEIARELMETIDT